MCPFWPERWGNTLYELLLPFCAVRAWCAGWAEMSIKSRSTVTDGPDLLPTGYEAHYSRVRWAHKVTTFIHALTHCKLQQRLCRTVRRVYRRVDQSAYLDVTALALGIRDRMQHWITEAMSNVLAVASMLLYSVIQRLHTLLERISVHTWRISCRMWAAW